jgi:hypothetical protein
VNILATAEFHFPPMGDVAIIGTIARVAKTEPHHPGELLVWATTVLDGIFWTYEREARPSVGIWYRGNGLTRRSFPAPSFEHLPKVAQLALKNASRAMAAMSKEHRECTDPIEDLEKPEPAGVL